MLTEIPNDIRTLMGTDVFIFQTHSDRCILTKEMLMPKYIHYDLQARTPFHSQHADRPKSLNRSAYTLHRSGTSVPTSAPVIIFSRANTLVA